MCLQQDGGDAEAQLQRSIDSQLRKDLAVLADGAATGRIAVTILLCEPTASSDRCIPCPSAFLQGHLHALHSVTPHIEIHGQFCCNHATTCSAVRQEY